MTDRKPCPLDGDPCNGRIDDVCTPCTVPGPRPVLITHPGCDVEPMFCETCAEYMFEIEVGIVCRCDYELFGADCGNVNSSDCCRSWTCRKCGGEVTR